MSAELLGCVLKKLERQDFRVLIGIELGMVSHAFTPVEHILKYSSLTLEETTFRLRKLHRFNLIKRRSKPFLGYTLNALGYDCLALNALVKGGYLEALGKPLGIGKESDVYDALAPKDERVAVKFMRVGRTSFRQTRKTRLYIAGRRHISWIYQSRLAAEREFKVLALLHKAGVRVPKPLAWNRHVLVMEVIMGTELADYYEIPNPEKVFDEIVENIHLAYTKAKIIHADLSAYNVLIKPDGHILLIDWPQCVEKNQPESDFYLRRDVENVVRYFNRKFRINVDIEKVLILVKGEHVSEEKGL